MWRAICAPDPVRGPKVAARRCVTWNIYGNCLNAGDIRRMKAINAFTRHGPSGGPASWRRDRLLLSLNCQFPYEPQPAGDFTVSRV